MRTAWGAPSCTHELVDLPPVAYSVATPVAYACPPADIIYVLRENPYVACATPLARRFRRLSDRHATLGWPPGASIIVDSVSPLNPTYGPGIISGPQLACTSRACSELPTRDGGYSSSLFSTPRSYATVSTTPAPPIAPSPSQLQQQHLSNIYDEVLSTPLVSDPARSS